MEKTKRRIEALCIIALLVIMLPSLDFLAKKAFADLTLELITPTGGALDATSDCTKITASNGIIWHSCNNILYAINDSTHVVIANISATIASNDGLVASIDNTAVYHSDNDLNSVTRYTLVGSTISITGTFTPSGCAFSEELVYDASGFFWITCDTSDELIRFNPVTMTQVARSGDLTDAVGLDCDSPQRVVYDSGENIGLAYCLTTGAVLSFEITSPTVMTLLDSETIASVIFVTVDSFNNRFVAVTSTGATSYSYTTLGILAVVNTVVANNDECDSEKAQSANGIFIACADDSGTNTNVVTYHLNTTGIFLLSSSSVAMDNNSGVGLQYGSGSNTIFYIVSNTNDQRYIKVSGVRDSAEPPTPPSEEEEPNIVGGVNCALPENENKLICRVTDNGAIPNFVIGNGTNGFTGFLCNIGVVDCESDSNPRTNGLGLLIFIGSLFLVVGMFYITIGRDAFTIPIYIWIVIILALSAFFTVTGLIEPIFLILTAVALIALAATRLQGIIGGKNTLGGGSSA